MSYGRTGIVKKMKVQPPTATSQKKENNIKENYAQKLWNVTEQDKQIM